MEPMMMKEIVVKPEKINIQMNIMLNVVWWGIFVVLIFDNALGDNVRKMGPLGFIILGSILFIVLFRPFVATMRTFVLTLDGCQVCILGYKKLYRWDELKTKRIVNYEYDWKKYYYKTCLELSKKKIKILKTLPSRYCGYFRPFSFIYIYFGEKTKLSKGENERSDMEGAYHTDEPNLVEILQKWHVEIEETQSMIRKWR